MVLQVINHNYVTLNCPGMVRVFIQNDATDFTTLYICFMHVVGNIHVKG